MLEEAGSAVELCDLLEIPGDPPMHPERNGWGEELPSGLHAKSEESDCRLEGRITV